MPLSMKKLESQLQDLEDFDSPKVELEQYATPPHIAAYILNYVSSHYKDIQNKVVADLGCGTGRLSLGSILLGASHVIGFDIDSEALSAAQNNVLRLFGDEQSDNESDSCDGPRICRVCPQINFVQADLNSDESGSFFSKMDKMFDTVIMNPPFGTKGSLGIDVKFLELAVKLANCSVYSLHKSSTRNYIGKKCLMWGVIGKPIAQIKYNLSRTYEFHQKKSVDVDVDLWRVKVQDKVT